LVFWGCPNGYHKLSGFNSGSVLSFSSGGQKSKVKDVDRALLPLKAREVPSQPGSSLFIGMD
jgi:hypothetical protein